MAIHKATASFPLIFAESPPHAEGAASGGALASNEIDYRFPLNQPAI
jgi:hypothetical protein